MLFLPLAGGGVVVRAMERVHRSPVLTPSVGLSAYSLSDLPARLATGFGLARASYPRGGGGGKAEAPPPLELSPGVPRLGTVRGAQGGRKSQGPRGVLTGLDLRAAEGQAVACSELTEDTVGCGSGFRQGKPI